jgi:hypothetical protein
MSAGGRNSWLSLQVKSKMQVDMETKKGHKASIHISDLHFEHKLWKRQLDFYRDELSIFEHRLEELVQRWTDNTVLAQLEQYQNRFVREREVIDELRHDVNEHANQLAKYAQEHPVAIDRVRFEDQVDLRDRMETFQKLFAELKSEFMVYVAKYL